VSEIKLGNYRDKDLAYPRFIRNHLDFGLENAPFFPLVSTTLYPGRTMIRHEH